MKRTLMLTTLVALTATCWPGGASASPPVRLTASFHPNRLGARTTVTTGFAIDMPDGQLPSPVVSFDLRLPLGVTLANSSLGLATCAPATLAAQGLGACSPESVMGRGQALVGISFGPEVVYEPARLTLLMAPAASGHTRIVFYAVGASPVIAQLLFPSLLLDDTGPFGGRLDTTIEPIAGLPGTPDGAVVALTSTIGPQGVAYYRRVHGRRVAYTPEGFSEPPTCPRGGFPFEASFAFLDGTTQRATAKAPCPRRATERSRS
jgi:hypothetical protein